MSDPYRTDGSHALDAGSAGDRDAKIEQLLLTGLDHYFCAQYEQAINVWTRALFLDRNHARARAYIERARSALAERQRDPKKCSRTAWPRSSVETASRPVAAHRHRRRRARRRGVHGPGSPDSAGSAPQAPARAPARLRAAGGRGRRRPRCPRRGWRCRHGCRRARCRRRRGGRGLGPLAWRRCCCCGAASRCERRGGRRTGTAGSAARAAARGEMVLRARARSRQTASSMTRSRPSIAVRTTDPQQPDADRLRGIQHQLIALARTP